MFLDGNFSIPKTPSLSLRVAIGTQASKIFSTVVHSISIDMINMKHDWFPIPFWTSSTFNTLSRLLF